MGRVEIADHGTEVIVYLSGDITESDEDRLNTSIDQVTALERLSDLSLAVVDMHKVTSLGPAGTVFLRRLQDRGERNGFDVTFATVSAPAHRALEDAGWSFIESSPPRMTT